MFTRDSTSNVPSAATLRVTSTACVFLGEGLTGTEMLPNFVLLTANLANPSYTSMINSSSPPLSFVNDFVALAGNLRLLLMITSILPSFNCIPIGFATTDVLLFFFSSIRFMYSPAPRPTAKSGCILYSSKYSAVNFPPLIFTNSSLTIGFLVLPPTRISSSSISMVTPTLSSAGITLFIALSIIGVAIFL